MRRLHEKWTSTGRTYGYEDDVTGQPLRNKAWTGKVNQKNIIHSGTQLWQPWIRNGNEIEHSGGSVVFEEDRQRIILAGRELPDSRIFVQRWNGATWVDEPHGPAVRDFRNNDFEFETRLTFPGAPYELTMRNRMGRFVTSSMGLMFRSPTPERIRFIWRHVGLRGPVKELISLGGPVQVPQVVGLQFRDVELRWRYREATKRNYRTQRQGNIFDLDILMGPFDVAANELLTVFPDTWGPFDPATDADDGVETGANNWASDGWDADDIIYWAGTDWGGTAPLHAAWSWVPDLDTATASVASIDTGTQVFLDKEGSDDNASFHTGGMFCQDAANPAQWSGSNLPSNATTTVESEDGEIAGSGSNQTIGMVDPIEELVITDGNTYDADNRMNVVMLQDLNGGLGWWAITDTREAPGNNMAELTIEYTPAAAGSIEEPLLGELDLLGLASGLLVDIGVPAGTADTDGLLPALGLTITVPAGLLTIDTTGTVPTAEITHTRQIPTVTPLLITPVAPSAEITHIRGPPQGELALTGQLPTIAITISVPVPLGELDLLGLASSANVTHNRAVPAGSASLTGLTETLDTAYGVPADALALAGLLPTISVESGAVVEEPPAGSLALTGLAPDIGGTVTIAVAKGELVIFSGLGLQLRGITPTIAVTGNIVSEPPADTLALTGLQSTAETEHTRQMGAGSLALATLQPSAETEHTRQVPAGSAALTGQLPTISVGVGSATAEPLLGSLTLAGKTPALEIIISNADSSLFFTGQAPTPLQNASPPDIITSPGDGSLTIAGLVPERASGLLLTGLAPTVLGDRQVLPEDGALTLTGLTPTVFGENPTIEVPVGSLSINGLQPSLPDFVAPGTGALTLTGLQPRFEGPQQASPPPDNLVLTGYAPTIVVPTPGKAKAGGRRRGRKPRKFSIEIDGELFVVNTVMEAIDLLRVAKQEAKTAPLPVKKPRIRIVGTASKTARLEVERAQRVVSRTFSKRLDAEIAGLMRESEARQKANTARIKRGMVRAKRRAADDEEAIAVLLLLS